LKALSQAPIDANAQILARGWQMDSEFQIEEKAALSPVEFAMHYNKIWEFSKQQQPTLEKHEMYTAFNVMVNDAEGARVAGACGYSSLGNFVIEIFWIDEKLRGRGLGKKLYTAIEAIATRRKCSQIVGSVLSLHDNIGFWKNVGFHDLATLPPTKQGVAIHYLHKKL
jgi:GNAT superfamily N-acetyltransferase